MVRFQNSVLLEFYATSDPRMMYRKVQRYSRKTKRRRTGPGPFRRSLRRCVNLVESPAVHSWRRNGTSAMLFVEAPSKTTPRGTKQSLHGRELQETVGAGLMGCGSIRTLAGPRSLYMGGGCKRRSEGGASGCFGRAEIAESANRGRPGQVRRPCRTTLSHNSLSVCYTAYIARYP